MGKRHKDVRLSRFTLGFLLSVLALSLLSIGYLLGREQRETAVVSVSSTATVAALDRQEKSLEERLDALDKSVARHHGRLPQDSPDSQAPSLRLEGEAEYLRAVDEIVGGREVFSDGRSFSHRLLEQAMASGGGDIPVVLARVQKASDLVEALEAPSSCREHHRLLREELHRAVGLLTQVKASNDSGDTSALSVAVGRVSELQGEADKLRELDLALRSKVEISPDVR